MTTWVPAGCINPDVVLLEPELLQTQDVFSKLRKKGVEFSRVIESSSLEVIAFSQGQTVRAMKDAPVFHDRLCAVYRPEFRKSEKGKAILRALEPHGRA